jgi:hypothetical protein
MGFVGDALKGIGKGVGWAVDKVTDIPVLGDAVRYGSNFIPGVGPLVSMGINGIDAMYDQSQGGGGGALGQMGGMGGGFNPMQAGNYGAPGGGGGGGIDWGKLLPMILGGGASIYGAIDANKDSSRARELAEQAVTTAGDYRDQSQARWDKYSPIYEQGLANYGPSENPFFSNPLAGLGGMGQAPSRPAAPPQRISSGAVGAATQGIAGPRNIPGWSGTDIQQGFKTQPWEGYGDTSRGIGGTYSDLNKLFDPGRLQQQPQSRPWEMF